MKFGEVPDEFIDVLMEMEGEVKPEYIIKALKWASDDPEAASFLADKYSRLGRLAREEFEFLIRHGYEPWQALRLAKKRQAEISEERSILTRALNAIKKGGAFRFKMPNGVECIMTEGGGCCEYRFTFLVDGSEIVIERAEKRNIGRFLADLMKGILLPSYSDNIIYNGRTYNLWSPLSNILVKAIMENARPEVLAAIE